MTNPLFPTAAGKRPLVIGLLGGVASGKSLVAAEFARRGAVVLDADRAAHAALEDAEVRAALKERWTEDIFLPDGRVNRQAVAGRVFGDGAAAEAERHWLQVLTHPRILRVVQDQAAEALRRAAPMVVIDAALLLEAGWDRFCDHLIFVESPQSTRVARAANRGWTEADLFARETAQTPLALKRARADLIIENTGTPGEAAAQVARLWSEFGCT